ncbi:MAG TPA: hypothetical protein VIG94_08435 [Faecalibacter sp.]
MNVNTENRIANLLNSGYKVQLNHVFGGLSHILKGIFGYAFLAIIIYSIASYIISLLVGMIFPVPSIDSDEIEAIMEAGNREEIMEYYSETFSNPNFGISTFATNLISAFLYPIIYSIYVMAYKYDHMQKVSFDDIFIHYKNGKFLNLFLITIILQILTSIGFVLCIVPGFILSSMWLLSVPLIIFADADVKEALDKSMKLAFKDFGSFLLLFLSFIGIGIVCAIFGIVLCCVGLLFTMPLFYVIVVVLMYSFYKEVVGFDENDQKPAAPITDIYKDNPYMN